MSNFHKLIYGYTLADGGCTIPLYDGAIGVEFLNPKKGYVVGGCGDDDECDAYDYKAFQATIEEFIMNAYLDSNLHRNVGVGTWLHEGKIVFDIVEIKPDKETAIDYGNQRKQKAIYSCEDKETIYL